MLNEVLPDGVLVPVTGAGEVGDALVRDKRVGKIMFTGSVKTGMKVVEASAGNLPRLTLELGGNDAGIVLPDVDPEGIAEGLFWGAFINNGQTCAALKRLYVPDEIYDQVVDALAAFTAKIPMGVGLDDANLLGPLQNEMQWNVVNRLVEDAKGRGAHLVMGGNPDPGQPGYFYPKTLVTDIDNDAPLVQEEQFGQALPIIRYTDLEQAVEWANAVDVGLGASVWSADRDKAKEIAARLQAGHGLDQRARRHPPDESRSAAPRSSGYGLEFGVDGLKVRRRPPGHQRVIGQLGCEQSPRSVRDEDLDFPNGPRRLSPRQQLRQRGDRDRPVGRGRVDQREVVAERLHQARAASRRRVGGDVALAVGVRHPLISVGVQAHDAGRRRQPRHRVGQPVRFRQLVGSAAHELDRRVLAQPVARAVRQPEHPALGDDPGHGDLRSRARRAVGQPGSPRRPHPEVPARAVPDGGHPGRVDRQGGEQVDPGRDVLEGGGPAAAVAGPAVLQVPGRVPARGQVGRERAAERQVVPSPQNPPCSTTTVPSGRPSEGSVSSPNCAGSAPYRWMTASVTCCSRSG